MPNEDVGRFRDDAARDKFLAAYEKLLQRWPGEYACDSVRTSFGEVHVRRAGRSGGPPVVLLHGSFSTSGSWYPAIAALAEHYELHAFDGIGEPGYSEQIRPIRDAPDEAACVAEAISGLGLDRVHLVGMSRGGFLAVQTAAYHGDRLRSLSLIEPFGFAPVRPKFHVASGVGVLAMLTPPPMRRKILRAIGNGILADRDLFRLMVAGASGFRTALPPLVPIPDEDLHAIDVPTMALFGQRSNLHHAHRARNKALATVRGVEVEILPRGGHALPFDLPDQVTDRLLRFLATSTAP